MRWRSSGRGCGIMSDDWFDETYRSNETTPAALDARVLSAARSAVRRRWFPRAAAVAGGAVRRRPPACRRRNGHRRGDSRFRRAPRARPGRIRAPAPGLVGRDGRGPAALARDPRRPAPANGVRARARTAVDASGNPEDQDARAGLGNGKPRCGRRRNCIGRRFGTDAGGARRLVPDDRPHGDPTAAGIPCLRHPAGGYARTRIPGHRRHRLRGDGQAPRGDGGRHHHAHGGGRFR